MRRMTMAMIVLASCSAPASPRAAAPEPDVVDDAAAGVDSPRLAAVLEEHWEWRLRDDPMGATRLGVHTYDDKITDNSKGARERRRARHRAFLDQLGALQPRSPRDRVTVQLLAARLRARTRTEQCRFELWNVNARNNPLVRFSDLPRHHTVETPADAHNLRRRYEQIPTSVVNDIEALREGANEGLFASQESIRRVVAMFDQALEQPVESWALSEVEAQAEDEAIAGVVAEQIKPAFAQYRDVLRDELLGKGRAKDKTGMAAMPGGQECYAALIEQHTSLPLSAQVVHEIGLAEIAKIDEEIAALGAKALGTKSLAATLERLRTDPDLYFDSSEAVEAAAIESLDAARSAMPRFFGRLPKAPCVVKRVAAYKAPFTTIAYYDPPHADGSKPGEYFINVFAPKTRPRFEARVLAVHESIPGHHLQIAIAQELGDLPAFRRYGGLTVFVEGWGLYTERLADEMGLYESDLDRMGMLSFDAWRAGRLVVDTGIHALGWSRDQAEQFLLQHTALTQGNITNEVDRYIGWPGQALGYKIGQLEIWKLRREAEAALGDGFDLKAFHDAVLEAGPVTLPVLRQQLEAPAER